MESLGLWVVHKIEDLSRDEIVALTESVAKLFVEVADAIFCIVAERDTNKEVSTELPTVLPHQIAKMDMPALSKVIQQHHKRLERNFTKADIDNIVKDFISLKKAARDEPEFLTTLNQCESEDMGFRDCWLFTNDWFLVLQQYCGGLSFVLINTFTVESDFTVISAWRKTRTESF